MFDSPPWRDDLHPLWSRAVQKLLCSRGNRAEISGEVRGISAWLGATWPGEGNTLSISWGFQASSARVVNPHPHPSIAGEEKRKHGRRERERESKREREQEREVERDLNEPLKRSQSFPSSLRGTIMGW